MSHDCLYRRHFAARARPCRTRAAKTAEKGAQLQDAALWGSQHQTPSQRQPPRAPRCHAQGPKSGLTHAPATQLVEKQLANQRLSHHRIQKHRAETPEVLT